MLALYFSPMLLGLCLLIAVAIAATALWHMSRPYAGPGFWMAGSWSLIGGVLLFVGFMATGSPTLNVLGNVGQLAGEALFILGLFRFMDRPLPWWILPVGVGLMVLFNVHYWMFDGNSDFLMGVYSTIAGLLPVQAIWLLLRERPDPATRPARLLVGCSLLIYSVVTLLRGYLGYHDWWMDKAYTNPTESFSYLLPYNFAIPALVMGFIGMTLMTMQRILAASQLHAEQARENALRFERLLGAATSGVAIVRNGLIKDANLRLEQLVGLPRQRLLGQPVLALFPPHSHEIVQSCLEHSHVSQLDLDALHADGNNFPAETSIAPLNAESRDLVLEVRDVSHRKALEQQLQLLATQDSLTGALNRRAFNEQAQRELMRSARYQRPMSMAVLDLDHFKRINDDYGHLAGDLGLRQFADLCRTLSRQGDLLSRFGGEEFVLLLPDTDATAAIARLERLREEVSGMALEQGEQQFQLQVSIGLAVWQVGDTLESLFRRADQALYAAKSGGRNRVVLWSDKLNGGLVDV
ncbi:MAG: GGDEF domain-containing protein [Pseudomonas sp.]